ncbi:hypothetical protein SAMN06265360_114102 [Haloechinothrix alba]|uniref:Uncharacterized protein n=2 Tax=Haloechinothrix alba TaxID=664784 RepID=A0A238YAV6_9PSEU|nr:hypothetical protein SAMN06265360_114102 [Haloechinothrix alba]
MPPGGGYGPGFAGPPPKKRTGLWVGLGAGGLGVLALAALLVTGFVAPGFFLSGDDPDEIAESFATAVNDRDLEATRAVMCTDSSYAQRKEIDQQLIDDSASNDEHISVTGPAETSDDGATVPIALESDVAADPDTGASSVNLRLVLVDEDGWCIDDMVTADPAGTPDDGPADDVPGGDAPGGDTNVEADEEGMAAIEEFVDAINDGDDGAAVDMLCDDAADVIEDAIERAVADDATISGSEPDMALEDWISVNLAGSRGGRDAEGNLMVAGDSGSWCVSSFGLF